MEYETCGHCKHFTGEECDGIKNEGDERFYDSEACSEFEKDDLDQLSAI